MRLVLIYLEERVRLENMNAPPNQIKVVDNLIDRLMKDLSKPKTSL